MNFDDAKENMQPLPTGRNPSILQALMRVESPQELQSQRRELEKTINEYNGDDPLEPWYAYISWIEQSFPSGGKESGLEEVLMKCLSRFEGEEHYYQDRRMIKLYIKFIDSHKNPTECYQQLHNAGIGTMVADLYICWAYYYDMNGNTRRADEIFRRGLACRAQPIEELKEAHQHFGFSVAQRVIYQDDDNAKEDAYRQLQDRRFALTSLRGYRRKAAVGSIRTGGAVKSLKPGVVQDEASGCARHFNAQVQVFSDENKNPNKPSIFVGSDTAIPTVEAIASAAEDGRSVVRSIIDAARNQENQKEPGPWNKAHEKKKSSKLFDKSSKTTDYGFSILEDDASTTTATSSGKLDIACRSQPLDPPIPVDTNCDMSFKYPAEFYGTNKPQSPWHTPVTIENEPENALPEYDKNMLYPRPHMEFQLEEYLAYKYYTNRGIKNAFTEERGAVWSTHDIEANVRQYPNFAKKSRPQKHDALDNYYAPPKDDRIKAPLAQIYNDQAIEEFQLEELLAAQWLLERNDTILQPTDMEETVCGTNERLQRRKSFFPLRKSIAPNNYRSGMTNIGTCTTEVIQEENESMATENEEIETACVNLQKSTEPTEVVGMQVNRQEKFSASSIENSVRMLGLADKSKEAATETSGEKIMRNEQHAIADETGTVVPPFAPFEIYQDATQTVAPVRYQNEHSPDAFEFKTPALPAIVATAKSTSSAFEIYNENPATSPSYAAAEITSTDAAGIYDAEETCSTQTFNIFLRSQSVSTPKIAQKTAPRQFGTLLQEIPVPSLCSLEESAGQTSPSLTAVPPPNTKLVVMPPESCAEAVVVSSIAQCYSSPHGKQLSTILETSEHATTQGTHTTTGASTKSTFSSPENENEANAACLTMPHRELEPLQEQSKEYSTTSTKVERHSGSFKLSMLTTNDVLMSDMTKPAENLSTLQTLPGNAAAAMSGTPGAVRLHAGGLPDFSIFCDTSVSLAPKQTGNFSRLEEREDTDSAAYALRPVRFQEDKTGTIPKILLTSQQHSTFQEDKTETISKILFPPSTLAKFEEDKTQTIPKITLTGEPCSTPYDVVNIDDSFEFFGESPPKAQMRMKAGLADSSASASAHIRTPLMSNAKRYCDKDTPELHSQGSRLKSDKNTSKIKGAALFPEVSKAAQQFAVEDTCIKPNPQPKETEPDSNQAPTTAPNKAPFRDFFMPDFSLTEEAKPTAAKSNNKNDSCIPNLSLMERKQSQVASTCILRDSFVTDFSPMEETQPQSQVIKSSKKGRLLLPGFSLIQETQPQATKPNNEVRLRDSFVPDFSLIEETQPQSAKPSDSQQQLPSFSHASVIKHTPPSNSASSVYNQPQTSDSFLTDFSMVMPSQPPNESASRWRQQPTPVTAGEIKADNKHMLSDFFMKDFSMSKEPQKQQRTSSVALNRSSTLKFLNDFNAPQVQQTNNSSLNQSAASVNKVLPMLPSAGTVKFLTDPISGSAEKQSNLRFLATAQLPAAANSEQYFELNAETEMFGTNNSMIGNSTLLPHLCSTGSCKRQSQIKETSLHIKVEAPSPSPSPQPQSGIVFKPPPPLPSSTAPSSATHASKLSFLGAGTRTGTKTETETAKNNSARISFDVDATELAMLKRQKQISPQTNCVDSQQRHQSSFSTSKQCLTPAAAASHADDDDDELSIYFKTTPKTPTAQVHSWSDESFDNETSPQQNNFVHPEVDLDQTQHLISNICVDPNVNPFNKDLINAFLDQIDFSSYIEQLPTCMLVGRIARLQPANTIKVHQTEFKVMKLVGEGAYGAVYCAKETKTGKLYALKQERPPNYWEYYVCLEVQSRLKAEEMLPAFMSVDYALIGNNSSILISPYAPFGSIISVCNKVKKHTMKNVDEYVVMVMVCELLEIIDHLHAVQIIHADIKADNVLVIQRLCYKGTERALQLIDYGVSIDMKHFKAGQTFTYVNQDNTFKCIEMREQRAWTYQLDFFGLAGIIHVLLFGKYMEVERRPNDSWMHKTHVPRYYNKVLWESIFQALLNVRDCRTLPNLQQLRVLLKQELVEKENYVCCKLEEFNRALQS